MKSEVGLVAEDVFAVFAFDAGSDFGSDRGVLAVRERVPAGADGIPVSLSVEHATLGRRHRRSNLRIPDASLTSPLYSFTSTNTCTATTKRTKALTLPTDDPLRVLAARQDVAVAFKVSECRFPADT